MKIKKVAEILDGKVLCHPDKLEGEIEFCFASDLMSDVLTVTTDNLLLVTGLVNTQAIRTAEMSDISTIVFVRNKKVTKDLILLAHDLGMVLIEFNGSMFKACGLLYDAGVKPIY
jgi:hypothetical protein